jgi:hypothetical protein
MRFVILQAYVNRHISVFLKIWVVVGFGPWRSGFYRCRSNIRFIKIICNWANFIRVLLFSLPIIILPTAPTVSGILNRLCLQWSEFLATEQDVSCFLLGTNWIYICYVEESRPPLWSSGQNSWLHNGDVSCFLWGTNWIYICYVEESRPPLWSSSQEFLDIDPEVRFRFPAPPDFLKSSGSGTGSTQPREYNWWATWKKK